VKANDDGFWERRLHGAVPSELKAMKRPGAILLLCLLAAVVPWIHRDVASKPDPSAQGFPGWSAAPLPAGLVALPLGPTEERFARQFPGKLAVFGEGNRTWIARWVRQPTRKLHPASDCLRASGYSVKPTSAYVDAEGRLWAACTARRDRETLRMRERIFAPDGAGWSDVSAWYWHALLGQHAGPWWAITVLERSEAEESASSN